MSLERSSRKACKVGKFFKNQGVLTLCSLKLRERPELKNPTKREMRDESLECGSKDQRAREFQRENEEQDSAMAGWGCVCV